MMQIVLIILGIVALAMGATAIIKGEVELSPDKKLNEGAARAAGIVTILVGMAVIGFALVGIPLLMSR